MEREQTRLIVIIVLIFIGILVFDRLGIFNGFQEYWSAPGHMFQILFAFVLILGAVVYLLSQKKPMGKEPQDFLHVFELWHKYTPSGRRIALPMNQIDWSRINKKLYNDKLVIIGKFPFGSEKTPEWRDVMIVLDPFMESVSETHTNEIYFGEIESIKIREKIKKGEAQLSPIEKLAMTEVEKEKIKEKVEETKEELE